MLIPYYLGITSYSIFLLPCKCRFLISIRWFDLLLMFLMEYRSDSLNDWKLWYSFNDNVILNCLLLLVCALPTSVDDWFQ